MGAVPAPPSASTPSAAATPGRGLRRHREAHRRSELGRTWKPRRSSGPTCSDTSKLDYMRMSDTSRPVELGTRQELGFKRTLGPESPIAEYVRDSLPGPQFSRRPASTILAADSGTARGWIRGAPSWRAAICGGYLQSRGCGEAQLQPRFSYVSGAGFEHQVRNAPAEGGSPVVLPDRQAHETRHPLGRRAGGVTEKGLLEHVNRCGPRSGETSGPGRVSSKPILRVSLHVSFLCVAPDLLVPG